MIASNKISSTLVNHVINSILVMSIFFLGCASHNKDLSSPQVQSSSRSQNDITVTVRDSAWSGSPSDLASYATPLYVEIQNSASNVLTLSYEDLVLLDENRNQYNALSPEIVADMLKSKSRHGYSLPVSVGVGVGGFLSRVFISIFGSSPIYSPKPVEVKDIFTQALIPGPLHPGSKLQGFVYFKKIPGQPEHFTLSVGYKVQGKDGQHQLSLPLTTKSD